MIKNKNTYLRHSKYFLKYKKLWNDYKKNIPFWRLYFFNEKLLYLLNWPVNLKNLELYNQYLCTQDKNSLDVFISVCSSTIQRDFYEQNQEMINNFYAYIWYAINRFCFIKLGHHKFSKENIYNKTIITELDMQKREHYNVFLNHFKKFPKNNEILRKIFTKNSWLLA